MKMLNQILNRAGNINYELKIHYRIVIFVLCIIFIIYVIYEELDDQKYENKIKQNDLFLSSLSKMTSEERNKYLDSIKNNIKNKSNNKKLINNIKKTTIGACMAELIKSGDISKITTTALTTIASNGVSNILL